MAAFDPRRAAIKIDIERKRSKMKINRTKIRSKNQGTTTTMNKINKSKIEYGTQLH